MSKIVRNKFICNVLLFTQFLLITFFGVNCKKLVEIPPPANTITTSEVFSNDIQATSAMSAVYSNMINSAGLTLSRGALSIYAAASADELIFFSQNNNNNVQFQNNTLQSNNPILYSQFWVPAYSIIYETNAILEGLKASSEVHDSVKNELIGEAEFVRSFYNFYLINLFGDIPLVTTINWHNTNLLNRTPISQVYQKIINDLKDAQNRLPSDFSVANGERIIPNKWAATALLARIYLYTGDWDQAKTQTTSIINNSNLFNLNTSLNNVFLVNSTEAIWQLQQSNTLFSYNATPEGAQLIPRTSTSQPFAYVANQLLNAFEPGDQRKMIWFDSTIYSGKKYYYPYKYKVGSAQAAANGPYKEYYMVLRLAEQYLIRAEAEAQKGEISNALIDLNIIRNRAGLTNYAGSTEQDSVLKSIYHERQVELFCEWGHRWLDLKRTNQVNQMLAPPIKPSWKSSAQLYPIPYSEINFDPNLTQNPGY